MSAETTRHGEREVRALVITGFGLNCERETARAFELAGARAEQVHLNDILAGLRRLDEFHILALIGGFSFGDHLGAGAVFANRLRARLRSQLEEFIGSGRLIIGICNGFQTLARLGLVPALDGRLFEPQVALALNDRGVFRDAWVTVRAEKNCPCVFTRGVDVLSLPIRHGEGRFVARDRRTLERVEEEGLAALRYVDPQTGEPAQEFPHNPNGSWNAIAGVCDPTGRVFGMMPHPEAYLAPWNHPLWTRQRAEGALPAEGGGLAIFRNAVAFAREHFL